MIGKGVVGREVGRHRGAHLWRGNGIRDCPSDKGGEPIVQNDPGGAGGQDAGTMPQGTRGKHISGSTSGQPLGLAAPLGCPLG